ncbi:calcitonin receptor-like [Littorina saxatilis]|uniref:calcitonin receptor-like n=1 Tax=Littorina saxatilis TaxID=31220 RepID=UPI0038B68DF0
MHECQGASLLPITAYIAVRVWLQHDSCWVQHAGHYEWILYGPQLLCIVANVFFFVSILRILMSELQSHPNEPSNFRRALKATILLVPLFGLQLFLVAYSPGPPLSHLVYEVTAKAVSCLQGAFVAIIFCFCNGEVQGQIRDTFSSRCRMFPNNFDLRSVTMSNNVTTMDFTRGSYSMRKSSGRNTSASNSLEGMDINNTHYIALNAWVQARSPDTNTD